MHRWSFILGVAAAAVASPVAARAQQSHRVYRVAYFGPSTEQSPPQRAFIEALGKLGFTEGKNLEIDTRGSGLHPGQYAQAAQELVQAKPDLIVCGGPEPSRAAKQATTTIPLLVNTDDVIRDGLVASIARPGGNVTVVSILSPELDGKRFEILLELLPNARRIGTLAGGDTANAEHFATLQSAARARGVELVIRTADAYDEIAPAMEAAKTANAAGLNVLGSALLFGDRKVIFERSAALGLPAIYQWPENAHEGGLVGYGPSITRIYGDQLSRIAAEILRGRNPGDILVERPTRFFLAVNLKVAKTLGLTISDTFLGRADEVIE
jgi:putative ABC transport system substrate-binding protein